MDGVDGESPEPRPPTLELNGQQHALYSAVLRKHALLAQIYLGGVYALASDNPDRHAVAAHCFRELMEKVRRYIPAPLPVPDKTSKDLPNMTVKVRELQSLWNKTKKASKSFSNNAWSGALDSPLGKFLIRTETFFQWVEQERPARKQQTAAVLRRLDPQGHALPAPIENLRIQEWEHYDEFFQDVAHHRINVEEAELLRYIDLIEQFLLDRLVPRTFDDYKVIDEIIKEGETDA